MELTHELRQHLRLERDRITRERLRRSPRVTIHEKREERIPPLHATGCNVILNDMQSRRFGQRCGRLTGPDGLCGVHRRYAHS